MRRPNDGNRGAGRRGLATVALAAAVLELLPGAGRQANAQEKPMLMFVQTANDVRVDAAAKTIRLVNVSPQTVYFADRPERIAGHIVMKDYLAEWTAKAGADNFGKDPPNASLSVYEPGQTNNTLAVVTIRNPRMDGADLVYDFALIDGTLPGHGGATSLFIDWIGVGGGVGPGFHGVGVGRRGVGWR